MIKAHQLGTINRNQIIPVNIHRETKTSITQEYIPPKIPSPTEIAEDNYEQVCLAIDAINIAIRSIVPNLRIGLENDDLVAMGYTFRKTGEGKQDKINLSFSPEFEQKLQNHNN